MRIPFTRTTVVPAALACVALVATGAAAASAAPAHHASVVTTTKAGTTKKPTATPARATVKISANARVTAGTAFMETIRGEVTYHGTRLGGRIVVLQARRTGSVRWTAIHHGTTGTTSGAVTFVVKQSGHNEQYRLVLLSGGRPDATSAVVTVHRA